ncbi:chemotaxis protein CheD [Noviherbaspirillum sp.]|uniref:chemotaxis protein CheD n=1 Tax=Noviherbaspirillum sp. TaxID=1926288 RepID=UPI002B48A770|nr:chemotaxis protein CheD [Noviherbaspirillum sp.]HJV80259.1 chemotaxis protein CheD [Noviherbaspirillum sp.]
MPGKKTFIEIFLQPGEYFVGNADYRIRTLLGSCVSITLWHPRLRIGAMSHFMLASRPAGASREPDGRYGEEVMWLMLRELRAAGVAASECQGKIFGGGDMFPVHTRTAGIHVGKRNGETARELLRAHGIPLVSESLFGVGHRQMIFDISSGHVWSRQVKPADIQ